MSNNKKEEIKMIWTAIFNRKSGNTKYTNLFAKFTDEIQIMIKSKIEIIIGEIPIISSYKSAEQWVLITTSRIINCDNGEITFINNNIITDVLPPQLGNTKKNMWNELLIKIENNKQFIIKIEEGRPFVAIWSIIKNIIARNNRDK